MSWVKLVNDNIFSRVNKPPQEFENLKFKHLDLSQQSFIFTVLSQYFLSMSVFCHDLVYTIIPVFTSNTLFSQAKNEIAIHFEDVKLRYNSSVNVSLNLKQVKSTSADYLRRMYAEEKMNLIVRDLFARDKIIEESSLNFGNNIYYQIDPSSVDELKCDDFDYVYSFLEKSYMQDDGTVTITPFNWIFSDDLIHSPAIKYFAHHFKEMFLIVDPSSNIIRGIHLI